MNDGRKKETNTGNALFATKRVKRLKYFRKKRNYTVKCIDQATDALNTCVYESFFG